MSALPDWARAMLPALFDEYVDEGFATGDLRVFDSPEALLQVSGFKGWKKRDEPRGLGFRYRRLECHDRTPYYNVRLVNGWTNKAGERAKYLCPLGGPKRLYVPWGMSGDEMRDISKTLYLVEGEKKTLAVRQFGYRALGFSGVYGLHDVGVRKKTKAWKLLPDFAHVGLVGSSVRVIVDADFNENKSVRDAMAVLKGMLLAEGAASADIVVSPQSPSLSAGAQPKSGIDDVIEHVMNGGEL